MGAQRRRKAVRRATAGSGVDAYRRLHRCARRHWPDEFHRGDPSDGSCRKVNLRSRNAAQGEDEAARIGSVCRNGERVVTIGTQQGDNFRTYVYRPAKDRIALEHTGVVLPPISIEERLLDLDNDGNWEYVRSGGESLIAKFAELISKE